ncbi:MAG: desulfoferrodoxin [Clostridia bacterium]|nr:desulfoferrodoxin [Clostridia bacterium]
MIEREKELSFYKCSICGKVIVMIDSTLAPTICCGREMRKLEPQSIEASTEKHVPVIEDHEDWIHVRVGSTIHPMDANHYIQWIAVQTTRGFCIKYLEPGEKPEAIFCTGKDRVINVWEYCTIHGLWEA